MNDYEVELQSAVGLLGDMLDDLRLLLHTTPADELRSPVVLSLIEQALDVLSPAVGMLIAHKVVFGKKVA